MNEYINVSAMQEKLLKILSDTLEQFKDEENSSFLDEEFNDDYLDDKAFFIADDINSDMNKYLHMKDHKIYGNFNNIDYDYNNFINGEVEYNKPLLEDLIKRLDDNDQSAQTIRDRNFINEWFFDTFGTYGISYNFGDEISEALYVHEQEEGSEDN